ncbi:hypothetical protein NSZ01_06610 [Nocardioides szechwanensis]|uniref:Uncharacterized protein n=1 Tax=Nocardioides szechwanensis TaxID=1005944 RepID=A0A1G9VLL7_9ACTN|nr:hypothetical protein [Nocardioides szechwanensis]GEP32893.1 hypothetical protein NSZ01_06610 [Nocardioides szechwanensis]SDM72963.1 hypothetical protein SAMN05192576_0799 [Nocardioides szechwanensis]
MSEYDVYRSPAADSPEQPATDEKWQVLVEYANNGQAKPPTKIHVFPHVLATREEAMAEAARLAVEHDPPDPLSPQGRAVYRDGEGFLSIVRGAMSTFHFSTRVVRFVGETDR